MVIGQRVSRMRGDNGWQFQFLPVRNERMIPMAILYQPDGRGLLCRADSRDISDQLPVALSRDEARYIVRLIPQRWPIFHKIHVEYTPTQEQ